MKRRVLHGILLLLVLLCLWPGSTIAHAQTQGPQLGVVKVFKGNNGLVFKPDAPVLQEITILRDEEIYMQLYAVENGIRTPFDVSAMWTEQEGVAVFDQAFSGDNPDKTAIWTLRGLKCSTTILHAEGKLPDGTFVECSMPLTIQQPIEGFCSDPSSLLSNILRDDCHLYDLKEDLGNFRVFFSTACGIHGHDLKNYQVLIDGKPATNVEHAPLFQYNYSRYALSIRLPAPVEGTPIQVQVITPEQMTYTLLVHTDTYELREGIIGRIVLHGDDPTQVSITNQYVSQLQGEVGETQWVCLYEKDRSGTLKRLDLSSVGKRHQDIFQIETDVYSSQGAVPPYVELHYLRPGETTLTLYAGYDRKIPLRVNCINPQLGAYSTSYHGDLIQGSEVSYGLLEDGDVFLMARDGFTDEDLRNCEIILDGQPLSFNAHSVPRLEVISIDSVKGIRVEPSWIEPDQVLTLEINLYHKNAEGEIFRHQQTLKIRDDQGNAFKPGLQFQRIDSDGVVCESAYPMDVIRFPAYETVEGIFTYYDAATKTHHIPESVTVERHDVRMRVETLNGWGRCRLYNNAIDTGTITLTVRIGNRKITEDIAYEVTQPMIDLYCSQKRTASNLAGNEKDYVELPDGGFYLLSANSFQKGEAAKVSATLDGKSISVGEIPSARHYGRYDLCINIPRPRTDDTRLLEVAYGDRNWHVYLNSNGHRWTSGLVVRRISQWTPENIQVFPYSVGLTQRQGTIWSYQFYAADNRGYVVPLSNVTLEAETPGIVELEPVTIEQYQCWSIHYKKVGTTMLIVHGTTPEGEKITLQEPVTVQLPEYGLYEAPVTNSDMLLGGSLQYETYGNRIWLLKDGGMTSKEASRCHIHAYENDMMVTRAVSEIQPLSGGKYGISIDLMAPPTPEGYLLKISDSNGKNIQFSVKPHAVMEANIANPTLGVTIHTDRLGTLYAVRYDNGRMTELMTREMGPQSQNTVLETPWLPATGAVFKAFAVNPDGTPMCADIDLYTPGQP